MSSCVGPAAATPAKWWVFFDLTDYGTVVVLCVDRGTMVNSFAAGPVWNWQSAFVRAEH